MRKRELRDRGQQRASWPESSRTTWFTFLFAMFMSESSRRSRKLRLELSSSPLRSRLDASITRNLSKRKFYWWNANRLSQHKLSYRACIAENCASRRGKAAQLWWQKSTVRPDSSRSTIQDEISFFAFINKRLGECAELLLQGQQSAVAEKNENEKEKKKKKSTRRKASKILVFHQSMTSSNLFLLRDPRPRCMCWWWRGATVSAFVDKLRVSLCGSRSWKWCSICAGKKIAKG